jgi:hypothetical protein
MFIKTKIVTRTSSRGMTPGPKATARPIIHKRMATVKIAQNTGLLLNVRSRFLIRTNQFGLELWFALKDRCSQGL